MKKLLLLLAFLALPTFALSASFVGTVLTLNGNAQNVSTALAAVLPAQNPCVKTVFLQQADANTGVVFVGGSTVSGATDAFLWIALDSAVSIGSSSDTGCVDISTIYVKGTNNEKLHISIIP